MAEYRLYWEKMIIDPFRLEKGKKLIFHFFNFGLPKTCKHPPPSTSDYGGGGKGVGGRSEVLDGWSLNLLKYSSSHLYQPFWKLKAGISWMILPKKHKVYQGKVAIIKFTQITSFRELGLGGGAEWKLMDLINSISTISMLSAGWNLGKSRLNSP